MAADLRDRRCPDRQDSADLARFGTLRGLRPRSADSGVERDSRQGCDPQAGLSCRQGSGFPSFRWHAAAASVDPAGGRDFATGSCGSMGRWERIRVSGELHHASPRLIEAGSCEADGAG